MQAVQDSNNFYDLNEDSRAEQLRHAETLRKFEAQKRARSISVPTAIEEVKTRLRELNQPVTTFGEGPADRRERLKEVIARLELNQEELEKLQSIINKGVSTTETNTSVEQTLISATSKGTQKEALYSAANDSLITARSKISVFSYNQAQERLNKRKEIHENSKVRAENNEFVGDLYTNSKEMTLNSSQFGDERPLGAIRYAPHGQLVATASLSSVVKIWEVETLSCSMVLRGHSERVTSIAWHPHASYLGTGSGSGAGGMGVMGDEFDSSVYGGGSSSSSSSSGSNNNSSSSSNGSSSSNSSSSNSNSSSGNDSSNSSSGACLIASASADGTCNIYDTRPDSNSDPNPNPDPADPDPSSMDMDNTNSMEGGDADDPENRMDSNVDPETSSGAGEAVVLHRAPVVRLKGHVGTVTCCDFHPHGGYIGTAGQDFSWRLWSVETGAELQLQDGHMKECSAIAFHPDGSILGSGDAGGVVLMWDLRSGQSIMPGQGHSKKITGLSFHANGYEVASSSADNTVKIWDLRKRRCAYTLPAHSNIISEVRYSKSGELLVTSSFDGSVKVWGTRDYRILRNLVGHSGRVMACDISPFDERHIVSAGYDRTFKVWAHKDEF